MAKLSSSHHHIIILCGGTGPRLWPLSRASRPKQFLSLTSTKSLLQETVIRALRIVPKDRIIVISNTKYRREVSRHVTDLIPASNLFFEPQKKNTAMAILYGMAVIHQHDPRAIITTLPSDHFIGDIPKFIKTIKLAASYASKSPSIVALGTKAKFANPSYGYIVTGKSTIPAPVTRFVEKPTPRQMTNLLKKGSYWNVGIYTFCLSTLESEFAALQPDYYRLYQKLLDNPTKDSIVKNIYRLSHNLAIDYAISQKSRHLRMLPTDFSWSDIGEWKTLYPLLPSDKNGIALLDKNTQFTSVNSSRCLVGAPSRKLIGLVGVNNLAVIDTPDALLICQLNDSFQVRDLVGKIVKNEAHKNYFLFGND